VDDDPADGTRAVGPADLARLKARATWSGAEEGQGPVVDSRRRAECEAARGGHVAVELEPDEMPRCAHCGTSLSPDALRRAGVKGRKA